MKEKKYVFSELNQEYEDVYKDECLRWGMIEEEINIFPHSSSSKIFFVYCLEGNVRLSFFNSSKFKQEKNKEIQVRAQHYTYLILKEGIGFTILGKNIKIILLQVDTAYLQTMCHKIEIQEELIPFPIPLQIQSILKKIQEYDKENEALELLFYQQKKYELLHIQCLVLLLKKQNFLCPCESIAVQKAHEILLQDLSQTPSLQTLAHKVGLSRTRLCTLFKEYYGDTVCGLLRQKRLLCAADLLSTSEHSITEIAYICGFSSSSHFTYLFSKHYHISPKKYRKNVIGNF